MEIEQAFQNKAFIPFIVAGDPSLEKSKEFAQAAIEGGADILEIGVPFSDPAADGATIQDAYQRSLKDGFRVKKVFELIKKIRTFSDTPIVLLSYYNPIYQRGVSNFYKEAEEAGVNGIIVPDLPLEEANQALKASKNTSLNQIFLVCSNTSEKRIKEINKKGSGFIYLVSHLSTTGAKKNFSQKTKELIKDIKPKVDLPLAVGFGISRPEHVKATIGAGADGAIVGSAIVEKVAEGKKPQEIKEFVEKMKEPIENP